MSKLSNFVVQLKPYICEKICEYVRYYFGTQDGWEKRSCETTHQFNRNFITFLGMPCIDKVWNYPLSWAHDNLN